MRSVGEIGEIRRVQSISDMVTATSLNHNWVSGSKYDKSVESFNLNAADSEFVK